MHTQSTTIAPSCHHCGKPLARTMHDFCCAGCEAVYRAVHALGLEEFYARRGIDDCTKVVPPRNRTYSYLDDDAFIRSYGRALARGTAEISLYLEGLHCTGCVWLLEQLPSRLRGLLSIRVNFTDGKLTIVFDPLQIKLSTIAQTLDSLGYPVHPPTSRGAEERERHGRHRALLRLGIAAFCAMNTMMLAVSLWQGMVTGIPESIGSYFRYVSLALSIPVVTYVAWPIYHRAFASLLLKRFHIDLPLSMAIIGTFLLSAWNTLLERENVYFDSVTALVFLLLMSRYIHQRATEKAQRRTQESWQILPLRSYRLQPSEGEIATENLARGDIIRVGAGERFPCDGKVHTGSSSVDRSTLSGEAFPLPVEVGMSVEAGTKNLTSPLLIEVERAGSHSRVGKLLERIAAGTGARDALTTFTDRAAQWFTIIVLTLTLLTFALWYPTGLFTALDNSLALLIVTCPCALGLATPLIFTLAQTQAARLGILIKGVDTIERISAVGHVFFDKTGTLTKGVLTIADEASLATDDRSLTYFREIAHALAGINPSHPVARAVLQQFSTQTVPALRDTTFLVGRGTAGVDSAGTVWKLGSLAWADSLTIPLVEPIASAIHRWQKEARAPLLLMRNEDVVWAVALQDELDPSAPVTIQTLCNSGTQVTILSGDTAAQVQATRAALNAPEVQAFASLTPEEKAERVEQSSGITAMVGDGVNDALAMREADLAIGIKGGIDGNLEVADVIILRGGIGAVRDLLFGARRTLRIIRWTLGVSVLYNVFGAYLAMSGAITPLLAACIMPLSSLTVLGIALWARPFNSQDRV